MALYEQVLEGEVDSFVAHLDRSIPSSSVTTKLEGRADHRIGDARMVVRVYERYSAMGGNRVSLSISVLSVGSSLAVAAVTSGGSQAMLWKVNTIGESSFLDRAVDAIRGFAGS